MLSFIQYGVQKGNENIVCGGSWYFHQDTALRRLPPLRGEESHAQSGSVNTAGTQLSVTHPPTVRGAHESSKDNTRMIVNI